MSDFEKCADRSNAKNGNYIIDCKLGLWGVRAPTKAQAEAEAYNYWRQYATDGEYAEIIGGDNALQQLRRGYEY